MKQHTFFECVVSDYMNKGKRRGTENTRVGNSYPLMWKGKISEAKRLREWIDEADLSNSSERRRTGTRQILAAENLMTLYLLKLSEEESQ